MYETLQKAFPNMPRYITLLADSCVFCCSALWLSLLDHQIMRSSFPSDCSGSSVRNQLGLETCLYVVSTDAMDDWLVPVGTEDVFESIWLPCAPTANPRATQAILKSPLR